MVNDRVCQRLCSDCRQIRFASQIRSLRQTVCSVICKWSDWICVSRHHQPICMGCCGNNIGVSSYVCWWRFSNATAWEKGILHLAPQNNHTIKSRCGSSPLHHTSSVTEEAGALHRSAAIIHLPQSGFDVFVVCPVISNAKDALKAARVSRVFLFCTFLFKFRFNILHKKGKL